MGFFDFMKDAGDDESAREGLSDAQFNELATENTVIRKLKAAGYPVNDMRVEIDGDVITLTGKVPDQRTREMAVLTAGNTKGVARVNDRLELQAGSGRDDFSGQTYTVKKGDTLSEIAGDRLGDASRWKEIFEANRPMLSDPDKIYPGQVLRMPA